jgi:NADH:ubiquinone oxidoreductase subunit H
MFLFILIDKIILPFIVILPVLIATAYFTLAERKVLASVQRRLGPTTVGF